MSTLNSVQVDHSVLVLCMLVGIRSEDSNCTMLTLVEITVHSKHILQAKAVSKPSVHLRMTIKLIAASRKVLFWHAKYLLNQWIPMLQTLINLKSELSKKLLMVHLFKEELKAKN